MKELIEYIARSLVDNPDAVSVTEITDGQTDTLQLTVAREDLGKIIGRQGRTARALRTLVSAAATRKGRHGLLEIQE